MVQTYTYSVPLRDPATAELRLEELRRQVGRLAAHNTAIVGFKCEVAGDAIIVSLRYAGRNRWQIQNRTSNIIGLVLLRAGLPFRDAKFVSSETAETARSLTLATGRPPMLGKHKPRRNPDVEAAQPWWGDTCPAAG